MMDNAHRVCEVCGSPMQTSVVGKKDICSDLCFKKDYWNELVRFRFNGDTTKDNRPVARINGVHYIIEDEENSKNILHKGFNGSKFKIEFICGPRKGECILTTNLWEQGDIPDDFKDSLPDNARFLELSIEERNDKPLIKNSRVRKFENDFMFKVYKVQG